LLAVYHAIGYHQKKKKNGSEHISTNVKHGVQVSQCDSDMIKNPFVFKEFQH